MDSLMTIIFGIAILILFVIVMRFIGAWMLRIDEVISNQKKIINELQRINSSKE